MYRFFDRSGHFDDYSYFWARWPFLIISTILCQIFYNPITDQAEVLKLLNLQHNSIKLLDGIDILRRLVFLDLYDNKIEGTDPQSLSILARFCK